MIIYSMRVSCIHATVSLLCAAFVLLSCGGRSVSSGSCNDTVAFRYSRLVRIKNFDGYSVARISNPWRGGDVIDTPVSPELLPADKEGKIAQKTEDLVGPYELHDFFLYNFIRAGYGPAKILFLAEQAFHGSYDRATILKWLTVFFRRFFSQQFKRSAMPDGPKVGSAALSPRGDWRMPSDASAAVWLKELETLKYLK